MGLDTLLRCIIVMVVSWFLAIIFETKQDIDRGLEYETIVVQLSRQKSKTFIMN